MCLSLLNITCNVHDHYRLQDALSNLKEILEVYKHIHHGSHSQGSEDIEGHHQSENEASHSQSRHIGGKHQSEKGGYLNYYCYEGILHEWWGQDVPMAQGKDKCCNTVQHIFCSMYIRRY